MICGRYAGQSCRGHCMVIMWIYCYDIRRLSMKSDIFEKSVEKLADTKRMSENENGMALRIIGSRCKVYKDLGISDSLKMLKRSVMTCFMGKRSYYAVIGEICSKQVIAPDDIVIFRVRCMEHPSWDREVFTDVLVSMRESKEFEMGCKYLMQGYCTVYKSCFIEGKKVVLRPEHCFDLSDILDKQLREIAEVPNAKMLRNTATNRCVVKGTVIKIKVLQDNRVKFSVKFDSGTVNCVKLSRDDLEIGGTYYFMGNLVTLQKPILNKGSMEIIDIYQLWVNKVIPVTADASENAVAEPIVTF